MPHSGTHAYLPSIGVLVIGHLVLALLLAGCGPLSYAMYVVAPDLGKKTVEPEFAGLPGKTVAVAIYADSNVQGEYPAMRETFSRAIAVQLAKNVKDCKAVDVRDVIRYQDSHNGWESGDQTTVGKDLEADYLLRVSLVEYSMHEPDSPQLYRGRITAEVALYDCSKPEAQACVKRWTDMRVLFPKEDPVGSMSTDARNLQAETEKVAADLIAKKFYKYKIEEQQ